MSEVNQYECLLNLVKKRRTVREFKSDPVPDEHVAKIIEVARWAPSAFHTQPWEFVVIKDPDVKRRVIDVLDRYGPALRDPAKESQERGSFKDAPVFILLLCDWRAKVGLPGRIAESDARVTSLYTSSLANTFLYMHLAATALGLASQWYTATSSPEVDPALREIIGIPKGLTIYEMMVLGYEASAPIPKPVRDTGEMTHFDDCGVEDFRTDEEVAAYAQETKAWCTSAH